ncbi:MAG: hypothetical protein RSA09_00150 [Acinetobacter sp.]
MKTKLEMAHEYLVAYINHGGGMIYESDVRMCFNIAEIMQAEADKREKEEQGKLKQDQQNHHDELVSIGLEEWQPDWSQAPKTAIAWEMRYGSPTEARWVHNQCIAGFEYSVAPSFGYTGDWRESLRKRPK